MKLTLLNNSDDPEFSENAAVFISENHSLTRDNLNFLWAVKQSIVTSLGDYFEGWQGQPQKNFKWALYFEEGREAQEYEIFELEQWYYVDNKLSFSNRKSLCTSIKRPIQYRKMYNSTI